MINFEKHLNKIDMAITQTPPVRNGCKNSGVASSDWWQNETTKTWWFKNRDTKEPYKGPKGERGDPATLIFNSVEEMRNMSDTELQSLIDGTYKSVTLLGYYQKGDTPAPIEYFLSNTAEVEDGGSVFEVGEIKLEHDFNNTDIDLRYFGVIDGYDSGTILNNVISIYPKFINSTFKQPELISVSERIIINNPVIFSELKIKPSVSFNTRCLEIQTQNVIINNFYFDGDNINNYAVFINGKNVFFNNVDVSNLKEIDGVNGVSTRGFHISSQSENCHIRGGYIKNIEPVENGISGDEQGAARAVTIRGTLCSLEGVTIDNVKGFEDGDCVHVQSTLDTLTQEWSVIDVTVKDCKIHNIYKTGVKIQASGVKVVGNEISSNWTTSITTHAGVRDYGTGNIIESNIIKLNRAKACIIGGAQGDYKNAVITGNYCQINPINEWNSTAASGSRIGTIFIERPCYNLNVSNNHFDGYGNIEFTVTQQVRKSKFNNNTFNNSGINMNYSTDPDAIVQDTEVNNNTFYATNATSSDASVIRFRNIDGVFCLDNTFYNVNRPVSVLGTVTTKRLVVKVNSVNSIQSTKVSTAGVTSGSQYVEIVSNKSLPLDNDTMLPLPVVSSVDANTIAGTKMVLSTNITNAPHNVGIIFNMYYTDSAGFQMLFGYNADNKNYYRRKSSGTWSNWISLMPENATPTTKGLVNQTVALANVSQADLAPITTADATDLPTALALLNELKAKYNLDVALTNAIKASQNTELTNQRTSGQQAP